MDFDFDDEEAFKNLQKKLEKRDAVHQELKEMLEKLKENEEELDQDDDDQDNK